MDFIKSNLIWIFAALASGGMLLWPLIRGQSAGGSVTPMQATIMINREDALMVDIREQGEYSRGHVAGSRHIPLAQFDKRLGELDRFKDKPIIIHCASGNRAHTACSTLKKAGFEKVFSLSGGISGWEQAGLPVTTK